MKTSLLRIIPIAVIAFALTGCSGSASSAPTSVADDTIKGLPDTVTVDPASTEPLAVWIEQDETFAVVTWGSSSCIATPIDIAREGDVVTIEFEPSAEEMCTADMAPTTYTFTVPKGMSSTPTSVELTSEEQSTPTVLPLT